MSMRLAGRNLCVLAAGLALGLGSIGGVAHGQAIAPAEPAAALSDLSTRVWTVARGGDDDQLLAALKGVPDVNTPGVQALKSNAASLEKNIAKREELRTKKLGEAREKLQKQLTKSRELGADAGEHDRAEALSEAVKHAVELFILTKPENRDALMAEQEIKDLVQKADATARAAEGKGDWFTANELFYRLNALLEESGTYKPDLKRLQLRLMMIRLYSPEQFWKLRNDERLKDKKSPLPPYNGLGENWQEKVEGIDRQMVKTSVAHASRQHIDNVPLKDLLLGGIDALKTMATTSDLRGAFPTLAEVEKVGAFNKFLDGWQSRINTPGMIVSMTMLSDFVDELATTGKTTLNMPEGALLHEFGNGAMSKLDDFSAIIWPDELARFDRMTQGNFRGVGVQIQLDDETQMIKVVTPLEGTPAQRAGIKTGDLIKKINGQSAVGISLNQAVDLITGPVDSNVTITMERKTGQQDPDGKDISQDIDYKLVRAVIPLASVKGWRRVGAKEDAWDWYVDKDNKIGYVRLLQFTEDTTNDLQNAVRQMKASGGVNGLVLDLRFNPGGLLTEAVSVANTFIDRGTIVSTRGKLPGEVKSATPGASMLADIPVAVLINEGSASASEIVSGAIRHYADNNDIKAIVVGQRSFGKGSVQNVWPIAPNAKMKLTTQYYYLPDGHRLHRMPGATVWGVEPHLKVDVLAENESDALKLRQDADVLPIDEKGNVITDSKTPRPDPQKLLDDGLDLQLQTALAILQAETVKLGDAVATQPRDPATKPN